MTDSAPQNAPGSATRGRLLAIDHGAKVIGLAVCDANWIAARPLQLLARKSRAEDFATLTAILARQQIAALVVGLPEQPEAEASTAQADTVRRWAARLAAAVNVPVYLWEEQFSSLEAERLAEERGVRLSGRIDDHAAAVILQSFIDAHPPGTPLPQPVKG
jgi:putative Holliday junction resolvase